MNRERAVHQFPGGQRLVLVEGDITEERVDAIVNAANSYLRHGGGVAGAIVRKGGWEIQRESDRIGYVPVGHAAITGAGRLPARAVIHAVGPRWGEGDEERKLASAVRASLSLARERGFRSVALPAISAGTFGMPADRCARVILQTVETFLLHHDPPPEEVRIVLLSPRVLEAFLKAFRARFSSSAPSTEGSC